MRRLCDKMEGPGGIPGLLRAGLVAVLLLVPQAAPLIAQEGAPQTVPIAPAPMRMPVLTLDVERLFETTLWGKRIMSELAQESAALTAENNRIAEDLIAEEKALTDRRATLSPEAFRAEADAFDARATGIRNAQKAKAQALNQSFETRRQDFYVGIAPLMDELLAAREAVVLLDRRAIIRGFEAADITEDLAALVDARLGDGAAREAAVRAQRNGTQGAETPSQNGLDAGQGDPTRPAAEGAGEGAPAPTDATTGN
ncbi:hypothetical protein CKO11_03805 [Rhodobacter sp. TJ_12]|uniref:OmpH family outer membrane protein n=1 Tax=Rhodobacter sp. TJ_12 TaxID=2029399 RepID=UPI001CBC7EF1|nr:OmpH family outer membrane protein [Rhodobacter sp. TJ_12]MBZ4021582.1 hypothetical protein [Rhodobacter sp. TJ_12]